MTVETIKVANPVKNNELMYIIIRNGKLQEAINVGEKTFNRIEKLLKGQQELPLENDKKSNTGKVDK